MYFNINKKDLKSVSKHLSNYLINEDTQENSYQKKMKNNL